MTPLKNSSRFSNNLYLTLVIFTAFALLFVIYVRSEKQIDQANELRLQSHLLADELRQSSDDLTLMVRSYVITGDVIYKQRFLEILDIRDGKKPRPVNYHNLYWYLVKADDQHPVGAAIALLELMRQTGFTKEELAKLAQAKANSDALTRTELAAMALIEATQPPTEATRFKASLMLQDTAYHQAKANIMQPISEFYLMMEQRTQATVDTAQTNALRLRIVFIVFGVLLVIMLWRSYQALHCILGGSVNELHEQIARLGSGDFLSAISVAKYNKNSVMDWLSETQHNLARLDTERKLSVAKNQRLAQLYAALSQCNQAIVRSNNEAELFPQICQDAVTFGGMKMAWIGLLNEQSKRLEAVAFSGNGTDYLKGIQISIDAHEAYGQGPTGTAMRENQPFWCQDFQNDPATTPWHERGATFGWKASAALPLHRNGAVIGAFTLYSSERNAFDEAARNLLTEMMLDIDFALENFEREAMRRQTEAALTDSLNLLQTIIDTAPVRIFWKDKALRYLGCNPVFAKDAGMASCQEVIAKDDYQLFWKASAELYRADDQRVMDSNVSKLFYEEPQIQEDGSTI